MGPLLVGGGLLLLAVGCTGADDGTGDGVDDGAAPDDTTATTWAAAQDLSVEPEPGTIVFHGYADDVARSLFTVDVPGGGSGTPLDPPTGFEGVNAAALAPDGATIAALAWREGAQEHRSTVLVGTIDEGFDVLVDEPDLDMWCVRWSLDAERLYVTGFLEDGQDSVLLSVDAATGETEALDLGVGRYECAIPLDDERMALAVVEPLPRLVEVDLATGEQRDLFAAPGCIVFGGVLSADGSELLTAASCDELDDSGVVAIDLASGDVEHLFVGDGSYPVYSPSGEWILFGVAPVDRATGDSTVWVQRRDGSGLQQVSPTPGLQAVWLAAAT